MASNTKMADRQMLMMGGIILIILAIAFGIARVWFVPFQAFRIVFGTLFTVFLPGFILSYIFFPETTSITRFEDSTPVSSESDALPGLDWIERITLAFALSLSVVPLVIYISNRLGLPITTITVMGLTAGVVVASVAVLFIKSYK